jgi:hypothetical protein
LRTLPIMQIRRLKIARLAARRPGSEMAEWGDRESAGGSSARGTLVMRWARPNTATRSCARYASESKRSVARCGHG